MGSIKRPRLDVVRNPQQPNTSRPPSTMNPQLIIDELWILILAELDYKSIVRSRAVSWKVHLLRPAPMLTRTLFLRLSKVSRYWKTLIEHSATLRYTVWLGIHGKVDQPASNRQLSIAERAQHLIETEELGWRNLSFPRQDKLELQHEQIRIMGYGGTCERSGYYQSDNLAITLGALPNASSPLPFQFEPPKPLEISRPDYTQDPALDVIIYRAR